MEEASRYTLLVNKASQNTNRNRCESESRNVDRGALWEKDEICLGFNNKLSFHFEELTWPVTTQARLTTQWLSNSIQLFNRVDLLQLLWT